MSQLLSLACKISGQALYSLDSWCPQYGGAFHKVDCSDGTKRVYSLLRFGRSWLENRHCIGQRFSLLAHSVTKQYYSAQFTYLGQISYPVVCGGPNLPCSLDYLPQSFVTVRIALSSASTAPKSPIWRPLSSTIPAQKGYTISRSDSNQVISRIVFWLSQ